MAAAAGPARDAVMRTRSKSQLVYGAVDEASLARPYDVVVVGGGPAGLAAAQKCAHLGRRALLVDDAKCARNELDLKLGAPTGLFSKALRDTAKTIDVDLLAQMGMDKSVIWSQVKASVAKLASNNAQTMHSTLTQFKVDYLRGRVALESHAGEGDEAMTTLVATFDEGGESRISARTVLLATGSRPMRLPSIPYDDFQVFDSDTIAKLAFLPRHVVIAGLGIIGIEFAKIFHKLKAKVTVLVRESPTQGLLRFFDSEIVDELLRDLAEMGVTILEKASAGAFEVPPDFDEKSPQPITIKLNSPEGSGVPPSIECDVFLAAMGRTSNSAGLGVAELGGTIAERGGAIKVDDSFHVDGAPPGIYAAGDLIGPPALASTSVEQAKAAVANALGEHDGDKAVVGRGNFPVGVWTMPEIGYYGFTKQAAAAEGFDAEEGKAPYSACLRGCVFAPQGFLKLVFDRASGRILGVHIMGSDACELIHYGMDLVNCERTIFDVMSSLFTAVTYHELFKLAAVDANCKLKFGIQWRSIMRELGEVIQADDSERLQQKFNELDENKSGEIEVHELANIFKSLGKEISKGTLANMVRLADRDGSGAISFSEFCAIISAVAPGAPAC